MSKVGISKRNIGLAPILVSIALAILLPAELAAQSVVADSLEGRVQLLWGDATSAGPAHFAVQILLPGGGSMTLPVDRAVVLAAGGPAMIDGRIFRIAFEASKSGAPSITRLEPISRRAPTAKAAGKSLGTSRWISLMCKYADVADEPKPMPYFLDMYGGQAGQLAHYWGEQSDGKLAVEGDAAGWFVLPLAEADYFEGGTPRFDLLFGHCVAAADPFVDFSLYQGINLMFNDLVGCCAWGGARFATLDGLDGRWGVTYNPPWAFETVGVIAHEMGHAFGLPHSDNADGDSDPYDSTFDVMSYIYGNAVLDETFRLRGKHTNAFHKQYLGWLDGDDIVQLTGAGTETLSLAAVTSPQAGQPRMIDIVLDETRSLVVEVREPAGDYDGALPGKAVLIYAVDLATSPWAKLQDIDVPPADFSDGPGVMWQPGEVFCSPQDKVQIRVLAETAAGYQIRVTKGVTDNCPPRAVADVFGTLIDEPLSAAGSGVLKNDSDLNGDTLQAELVGSTFNGSITLDADGSFFYQPDPGFEGEDAFTYRATDGVEKSAEKIVRIKVLPRTLDLQSGLGAPQTFLSINDHSAIGLKFDTYTTTQITGIGASVLGDSGSIYAALVELDAKSGEVADPSLGRVLAFGVQAPSPAVTEDVVVPVDVKLPPGRYALILGSGLYGASGQAALGLHESGDGSSAFVYGDPTIPIFVDWNIQNLRFLVQGERLSP